MEEQNTFFGQNAPETLTGPFIKQNFSNFSAILRMNTEPITVWKFLLKMIVFDRPGTEKETCTN